MEGQEVLVNGGTGDSVSNGVVPVLLSNENGLSQVGGDLEGKGNLAEEVLGDLEEYWEDINDRLMISRMVSDSVIKGMVTAMEQEAAEKITAKELEVAKMKEFLQSHRVGSGRSGEIHQVGNSGRFSCSYSTFAKSENIREELQALRNLAIEQSLNVKKELEFARTSNSLRKNVSGSRCVGSDGILPEKPPERWVHLDLMLENLEKTMDSVCRKVDDVLLSSKVSLCKQQEEQDLLAKLEGVVINSVLRGLKKEFEDNLWEHNVQFSRIQSMNWLEKFHELSNLGVRLDAISKSLSINDSGLVSHGSHDLDQLHHKALSNHVTPPTPLFGENGMLDASSIHVAETYDIQQLKHFSKEGLVNYFNDIITKMKRDHESALHQKTEEYFRLKREYLKERSSFVTHRKDEEFDVLRKRIPEVISKLEDFLLENERFPALTYTAESIGKMKHRLDSLLSENQQLRVCLTDKKSEVKHLEAQVAGATAQLLQHSLSKETVAKLVENLKSAVEESHIEASLERDVHKCVLRDQIACIRCDSEDSHMEFLILQEIYDIILTDAIISATTEDILENDDSEIESLITEGLCGLLYAEAIKGAEQKCNNLSWENLMNKEIITCLEAKALERENELRLVVQEKEKLKQEVLDMGTAMEQKEKLATDLSILLSEEREQLKVASQELASLRQHASQQQTENNGELQLLKAEHLKALEQIQTDKIEMHKLNQMLDQTKELLMEANEQRNIAFSHTQEMHGKLLSIEAGEVKLKKEVEIAVSGLSTMFDNFECRVSGAIKKNSSRLEDTRSHLKALNEMANALKRKGLMYKQRLGRRFADLQMAEAEVDLLGDEVDALLRLLEKIYIALDHYSPILKHYPGIIEILKLVRRELTGQSTKITLSI